MKKSLTLKLVLVALVVLMAALAPAALAQDGRPDGSEVDPGWIDESFNFDPIDPGEPGPGEDVDEPLPEDIVQNEKSHTGRFLAPLLERSDQTRRSA